MKKLIPLASVVVLVLAGCAPKDSYDKPDPAPTSNKFETATDKVSPASGASAKGSQEQSSADQ